MHINNMRERSELRFYKHEWVSWRQRGILASSGQPIASSQVGGILTK